MKVKEFELVNEVKVDRVIRGTLISGKVKGGIGKDAKPEDILAHYDKLGGLILKDGVKVKTGCFWNVKEGKPFENPKVIFVTELDGEILEVGEAEAKAVKSVKEKTAKLKAAKVKKDKKNSKIKK